MKRTIILMSIILLLLALPGCTGCSVFPVTEPEPLDPDTELLQELFGVYEFHDGVVTFTLLEDMTFTMKCDEKKSNEAFGMWSFKYEAFNYSGEYKLGTVSFGDNKGDKCINVKFWIDDGKTEKDYEIDIHRTQDGEIYLLSYINYEKMAFYRV